jgi:hypothetical protein
MHWKDRLAGFTGLWEKRLEKKEPMNSQPLAPIALFVYNRPELTRSTLEHLARNEEASRSRLYVFCDGPKPGSSPAQLAKIREVQEVVRQKPWCGEMKIIQSDVNRGLANSVIRGVTQVVREHGKVIVLEDDLSVSAYFLRYMNEALQMYETDKRVLVIHGYVYPVKLPASVTSTTFFTRDPGCWGWATWRRAWEFFEPDTRRLYTLIRLKGLRKPFTFWGGYPYMRMLRQQMAGKVDSWAIRWRAVAYLHDKLTLYPTVSLVRHDGNVPEATHHYTGEKDYTYTEISPNPVVLEKIPIENNEEAERAFGWFLKKYSGMSIRSKIKRRLKMLVPRKKKLPVVPADPPLTMEEGNNPD